MAEAFVVAPLNAGQSRVLRVVAEGGKIEARRLYPFPRKFHLRSKAGYEYAARVPEGTVSLLVELSLVNAVQLDDGADDVDYTITTRGVKAVKAGTALTGYDGTQLDLLPPEAPKARHAL